MDLAQEYVRRYLVAQREADSRLAEEVDRLEARGHRVIDGGQTGQSTWLYTDWLTGEVIASGHSDDHDDVFAELDPHGMFVHIDDVTRHPMRPDNPGIPESLASTLRDWVDLLKTTDEDIAQYVGWTARDVAEAR